MPQFDRRTFLVGTGLAAAGLTLASCTTTGGTGTGPITFWSGYSTTDANDKTKKPADFWISKSIKRFTDKTGIQVKVETLPGRRDHVHQDQDRRDRRQGTGRLERLVRQLHAQHRRLPRADAPVLRRRRVRRAVRLARGHRRLRPAEKDKILGVPNGSDGAMVAVPQPKSWPTPAWIPRPGRSTSTPGWASWTRSSHPGVTPLSLGKNSYLFFGYDTWLAQAVGGSVGIGELASGARKFSDPEVLRHDREVAAPPRLHAARVPRPPRTGRPCSRCSPARQHSARRRGTVADLRDTARRQGEPS